MDTRLNTKRILIFLAFAFGIPWAAALAIYLTTMMGKGTANPLLGPGPTGLIGGIGYTILALVLYFNRKAFAAKEEAATDGSSD